MVATTKEQILGLSQLRQKSFCFLLWITLGAYPQMNKMGYILTIFRVEDCRARRGLQGTNVVGSRKQGEKVRKIGPSDRDAKLPSIPVPPKRSEGIPPPSQNPLLLRLTICQCSASQLRWSQTWGFWENSLKEKSWQVPAGCYPSSSAFFQLHRSENHPFI